MIIERRALLIGGLATLGRIGGAGGDARPGRCLFGELAQAGLLKPE
jgi:hypothetical protein